MAALRRGRRRRAAATPARRRGTPRPARCLRRPAAGSSIRRSPVGRRSRICSIMAVLCSTSRMRIQTRALTSLSLQHRDLELELVVGRIAGRAARIEGAAGGAPDVAAGGEPAHQLGRDPAGRDRAVLQRGGVVVELDQLREAAADSRSGAAQRRDAVVRRGRRRRRPATIRSIISRWPKQASAARSTRSRSTPQWACISANAASLQIAPMSPRWLATRSSSAISARSQTARGGGSTPSAASAARAKASA